MLIRVKLQKSGMGIEEGTLARWLKQEGSVVTQGEVIAEVETAKAVQEIQAPVGGKLVQILVKEQQVVPVNTDLAVIEV
jgi:pyruvate/2-oxoglutarate dehydrogenase complex dihydrolipoamide acyltransferase (E2) component